MLLLPGLGAVALALSACDVIMEPGPGDGATPPPQQPANGGFTPDRERVVGFPALFPSQRLGHSAEETLRAREAEQEAARVRANAPARRDRGAGQLVGMVEIGANPEHPDLTARRSLRAYYTTT